METGSITHTHSHRETKRERARASERATRISSSKAVPKTGGTTSIKGSEGYKTCQMTR